MQMRTEGAEELWLARTMFRLTRCLFSGIEPCAYVIIFESISFYMSFVATTGAVVLVRILFARDFYCDLGLFFKSFIFYFSGNGVLRVFVTHLNNDKNNNKELIASLLQFRVSSNITTRYTATKNKEVSTEWGRRTRAPNIHYASMRLLVCIRRRVSQLCPQRGPRCAKQMVNKPHVREVKRTENVKKKTVGITYG